MDGLWRIGYILHIRSLDESSKQSPYITPIIMYALDLSVVMSEHFT